MQLDKVFELEDLLRNTGSSDRYQYTVGQRKLCQVQATLNPFFNLRAVLQWLVTVWNLIVGVKGVLRGTFGSDERFNILSRSCIQSLHLTLEINFWSGC